MQSRHVLLLAILKPRAEQSATLIAVGLVALLAAECWPAVPVISAIAIIALGATLAVTSRFRCSPVLSTLVAAHLLVYLSLYLLFVGAVIHTAYTNLDGMTIFQGIDVGLSIVPMFAAMRIALAAIAGDGDVPAR